VALVSGAFLAFVVAAALVGAPLGERLTGHPSNQQYASALSADGVPLGPWSRGYALDGVHADPHAPFFVLGADRLGRDALVRLLYGARVSLEVALAATSLAVLIGIVLGLTAGWLGGAADALISRAIEWAMAFPALLLAIGTAVVIGPGLANVIVVIALFSWYYPARLVRAAVIALRSSLFVEAARSVGSSERRIVARHVMPHLAAPLIVYASTVVAANVLFEAGLSYLGLGVPPPTPSWGAMAADGVHSLRIAPHIVLAPSMALIFTLMAFNFVGDGLRDALDPRQRR
jgi:ABC-type dipeptide/oligopeptide/nickel transport system permease subunit